MWLELRTLSPFRGAALATGLCVMVLAGCVERRMTILSDPPGALVIMSGGKLSSDADEHELGFTPVSTNFVYYGNRKITLIKDGYETLTVQEKLNPPWYDVFPLEFFSENLIPWRIRDHRTLQYRLNPQPVVSTQNLLDRGASFRESQQSALPSP